MTVVTMGHEVRASVLESLRHAIEMLMYGSGSVCVAKVMTACLVFIIVILRFTLRRHKSTEKRRTAASSVGAKGA